MQLSWIDEFASLVNWRINAAHMTQSSCGSESIDDLSHTDFAAVALLDAEIAGGQCSIDSGLDRGGLDDFANIGNVDDVLVGFGRSPRTAIHFLENVLLHFLDQLVEIIAKQIVQKGSGHVDALIDVGVAIVRFDPPQCSLNQAVCHMSEEK